MVFSYKDAAMTSPRPDSLSPLPTSRLPGLLLLAGVVYAWSVLSVSIAAEYPDWSRAKLSVTFTVLMALFCIGQISSGFIGSRLKPRYGVWAGAALLAAGFALSAYMRSAAVLYLGFGVLCGFGSGFAFYAMFAAIAVELIGAVYYTFQLK